MLCSRSFVPDDPAVYGRRWQRGPQELPGDERRHLCLSVDAGCSGIRFIINNEQTYPTSSVLAEFNGFVIRSRDVIMTK
jgi:hypothetical protein